MEEKTALQEFNNEYMTAMRNLQTLLLRKKEIEDKENEIRAALNRGMTEYGITKFDNEYLTIRTVPGSRTESVDLKTLEALDPNEYEYLKEQYPKVTEKKPYVTIKVKEPVIEKDDFER